MSTFAETTPVSTRDDVERICAAQQFASAAAPFAWAVDALDRAAVDINRLADKLPAAGEAARRA